MDASELTIAPATTDEGDVVLGILNDAAQWVVERGAEGWRPGQWRHERLLEALERGETFLARREGTVVATISLQWSDDPFRGDRPADAGYVHRLAVTADAHGTGIGRHLLAWAERTAAARGRSLLRLDCTCEDPRAAGVLRDARIQVLRREDACRRTGRVLRGALRESACQPLKSPFPSDLRHWNAAWNSDPEGRK